MPHIIKFSLFAAFYFLIPSFSYADCSTPAAVAGQFQWNAGTSAMRYCDGTNWISSQVTVLGTACSGAGTVFYTAGDLRFCNGSFWVTMKGASNGSCAGTTAGTFAWNGTNMRYCDGTTWWLMKRGTVALTIAASTANYNIFSSAGSPSTPTDVTVTINGGVIVYSNGTGSPAMQTGSGWNASSTVTIVNNGSIIGKGGAGGAGAGNGGAGGGGTGGDALYLQFNTTLNNGSGYVFGGGGGGGGGISMRHSASCGKKCTTTYYSGGGGGGGGAGNTATGGGGGGSPSGANSNCAGAAGGTGSGGGGGGGTPVTCGGCYGGWGGTGGAYGAAGATGQTSAGGTCSLGVLAGNAGGGAAGYAIRRNGYSISITAGNNGTQIKGSVL